MPHQWEKEIETVFVYARLGRRHANRCRERDLAGQSHEVQGQRSEW